MSIDDDVMRDWFTLLTDGSTDEINRLLAGHQNEAKKPLATDIAAFYHGADAAAQARADFEKQFHGKQDPDVIDDASVAAAELVDGKMVAPTLLVATKLATSKNEARRKIGEGAVTIGPDRPK